MIKFQFSSCRFQPFFLTQFLPKTYLRGKKYLIFSESHCELLFYREKWNFLEKLDRFKFSYFLYLPWDYLQHSMLDFIQLTGL